MGGLERKQEGVPESAPVGSPMVDIPLQPISVTFKFPSKEAQGGGGACPRSQSAAISFRFWSGVDCWLAPISVLSSAVIAPWRFLTRHEVS